MAHDIRDEIVDFINRLPNQAQLPTRRLLRWAGVGVGTFYRWRRRYGKVNEHNAQAPRDHWLLEAEVEAILNFHAQHSLNGYRRLTFMMNDADIVAVSPSSVYRVLRNAGLLDRFAPTRSKKGTGFFQPAKPHEHWHIDVKLDLFQPESWIPPGRASVTGMPHNSLSSNSCPGPPEAAFVIG